MTTYFTTWDFNTPLDFTEARDLENRCGSGETVAYRWSTGNRRNMDKGSTLLMVRQGPPPRGIIGLGTSTGIPERDARHDDPGREGNYVDAEWNYMFVHPVIDEETLPPERRGMRSGGIELEPALAMRLIAEFHQRRSRTEQEVEAQVANDTSITETERRAVVSARRGQGKFRDNVARIGPLCRVTGIKDPRLLRASHIKPWRACANNDERLDGNNGLLLAPHIDHLFDRGLLTFADNGGVLLSPLVDMREFDRLGLMPGISVGRFSPQQLTYLAYHREFVFLEST